MKRFWGVIVVLAVIVILAGSSHAAVINVRPAPAVPAGGLSALQNVFTGIGSSINVYNDQESAAIFNPTGFGLSSAALIANVTWGQSAALGSNLTFGIYSYTTGEDLIVTTSGSSVGTSAGIMFNFLTGSVLATTGDTQANFFAPGELPSFGFYLSHNYPSGSTTVYSEDSRNANGMAQTLIFAGKGDYVDLPYPTPWVHNIYDGGHYYIAFEGLPITSGGSYSEGNIDYNDLIVQMESVTPVPEPGTMVLLGTGLIGLASFGRKKFRK